MRCRCQPELLFIFNSAGEGCHEYVGLYSRCLRLGVVDTFGCSHEIRWLRIRNVHKYLWIAISQRKPRALHLHHDAMATPEGMVHILHRESYFLHFARRKRFGVFITVPEFSAEWFSTN